MSLIISVHFEIHMHFCLHELWYFSQMDLFSFFLIVNYMLYNNELHMNYMLYNKNIYFLFVHAW